MKKIFCFKIFVIAWAFVLLIGCTRSPADTVKEWRNAILDRDVKKADQYSTAGTHESNQCLVWMLDITKTDTSNAKRALNIVKEEINGKKAVVELLGDDGSRQSFCLVKENGEWKVDFKLEMPSIQLPQGD